MLVCSHLKQSALFQIFCFWIWRHTIPSHLGCRFSPLSLSCSLPHLRPWQLLFLRKIEACYCYCYCPYPAPSLTSVPGNCYCTITTDQTKTTNSMIPFFHLCWKVRWSFNKWTWQNEINYESWDHPCGFEAGQIWVQSHSHIVCMTCMKWLYDYKHCKTCIFPLS